MSADETAKTIRLERELTIYRAAEIKDEMTAALRANALIEMDLSGVTEVDGAGLQLMMLAKREARINGTTLRFISHSRAVLDVMDLANLSGEFGDPVVLSAR